MRRVAEPLRQMGAEIRGRDGDLAPLEIRGGNLHAIDYALPVPSAQVKSAILLAGLYAEGTTAVHESVRTRDHTELALREFGATVETVKDSIRVQPRPKLDGSTAYGSGRSLWRSISRVRGADSSRFVADAA